MINLAASLQTGTEQANRFRALDPIPPQSGITLLGGVTGVAGS